MAEEHSEYVVYVDESGDHGLRDIAPEYPVFVLAFCIFKKEDYMSQAVPALQSLKFKHFGHDQVILHEREIRKAKSPFEFLQIKKRREAFMGDLNELVEDCPFTLIASAIHKERLTRQYIHPASPYEAAMAFGLERVAKFLRKKGQGDAVTHMIFESRGKREDDQLELEFRRVCDGANYPGEDFPFQAVFASKRSNSCGLQIADLLARPIGRHDLDPEQTNRAFDLIEPKFDRRAGKIRGCGLKVFP